MTLFDPALAVRVPAGDLALRFPDLGAVAATRYVREAYHRVDLLNHVLERTFARPDGNRFSAFLIAGTAAATAQRVQDFSAFLRGEGIPFRREEHQGLAFYRVEDRYEGDWFFVPLGDALIGVYARLDEPLIARVAAFAQAGAGPTTPAWTTTGTSSLRPGGRRTHRPDGGAAAMKRQGSRHQRMVTDPSPSRRRFLVEMGLTAGAAAGFTALGLLSRSEQPMRHPQDTIHLLQDFRVAASPVRPDLVVVRGTRVDAMVREAVEQLGGIQRFIAKGDRVLLKPNVDWDRQPEQAANTNPRVVGAVARLCREAGAAQVLVSDVSLNDPARCLARSGVQAAAREAGAEVRLPGANDFLSTDMRGELLKVWPVSRFFHQADKLINPPLVKHHSLCGCTLAMKNWYGVLGGRRNRLHQKIHTAIVDLAAALRPTLTLMDATRVLKRNGPTGGSLNDVSAEDTLIAGLDEVAIDAYSLRFLDLQPEAVPFLALAEQRGLGRVDWRTLRVVESQVG